MKGEVYPLWYATNRRPNNSNNEALGYSGNSDERNVHYGKIFVEIPDDYLKELRSEGWLKLSFFKSPETKIKVRAPIPLARKDFFADIRSELKPQSVDERAALIYLHGFQTTFEEAAQRAAGIGYHLKMPVTAFFSWPSKGKLAGYEADRNSVEASDDQLANFLIGFAKESNANRVHIVAHSMGNYALLRAMFRPLMQAALRKGIRFGQIILAAPDVDARVFVRDAPLYVKVAERVTVYASSGDIALEASRKLAAHQRAGAMPPPTIVPGIDTLDVTSVNMTLLGHSYVANEIAVLEDMHKLIAHNDPPRKRTRIAPKSSALGAYWVLE